MLEQWTADLVAIMHLRRITSKELAAEVGWNAKYLSTVINGHRNPPGAKEKLNAALRRLIAKREATMDSSRRGS